MISNETVVLTRHEELLSEKSRCFVIWNLHTFVYFNRHNLHVKPAFLKKKKKMSCIFHGFLETLN